MRNRFSSIGTMPMCSYLAVLGLLLIAPTAFAQESAEEDAPAELEAGEDLTGTDQVVEVEDAAEDEDIASRLLSILETTGRFEDMEVRVENGVVFLSGTARSEEHKVWARELALRTQDVAAIVNNITVVLPAEPVWNFEPAFKEMRTMWRESVQGLPLFVLGFFILGLTIIFVRLATWLTRRILKPRIESVILREVIKNIVAIIVLIVGIYFFLRFAGLTSLAVAMLSGTGVLGLLVGFAFRDIAENFLASLLISVQRPFRVGDTIEVDGYTGIVQKVTTRGTVLMAFDGNYIQIANATVYKNTIRNWTANPNLRIDFLIGIGYDSSISEAQEIVLDVLKEHSAVMNEPAAQVLAEELGASTINLRVYFWINCREHSAIKVKSSVIRATLAALDEAGISMPDDAREIVFPEGVPIIGSDAESHKIEKKQARKEIVDKAKRERALPVSESEDDLSSEVDELNAQARASNLPEEGEDILLEPDSS